MSLIIDSQCPISSGRQEVPDRHELAQLDRYLAILEDNKKASRFIADDAAVALDMAAFVRRSLDGSPGFGLGVTRLSMALLQKYPEAPTQ